MMMQQYSHGSSCFQHDGKALMAFVMEQPQIFGTNVASLLPYLPGSAFCAIIKVESIPSSTNLKGWKLWMQNSTSTQKSK
mmetsp:Transcript_43337/g.77877  ORF Transcript_43337/g.77877 Transcript_43337/m.77877 type:complete len:80 (+) Transcript_43337:245-484(+)